MYAGIHSDLEYTMSLKRSPCMPMIDVYARADLFPVGTDRQLGEQLTAAVLRAEGVATPGPLHLDNRCPAPDSSSSSRRSLRSSRRSPVTPLRPPAHGCCSPKLPKAAGVSLARRSARKSSPQPPRQRQHARPAGSRQITVTRRRVLASRGGERGEVAAAYCWTSCAGGALRRTLDHPPAEVYNCG